MRGRREEQKVMLAVANLEERVPKDHPLRTSYHTLPETPRPLPWGVPRFASTGEMLGVLLLAGLLAIPASGLALAASQPQTPPPADELTLLNHYEDFIERKKKGNLIARPLSIGGHEGGAVLHRVAQGAEGTAGGLVGMGEYQGNRRFLVVGELLQGPHAVPQVGRWQGGPLAHQFH